MNKAGAAGMAELQAISSTVFGGSTRTGQRAQASPAFVMPPAIAAPLPCPCRKQDDAGEDLQGALAEP